MVKKRLVNEIAFYMQQTITKLRGVKQPSFYLPNYFALCIDYFGLRWVSEHICGQLPVNWEVLLLGVGWILTRTMENNWATWLFPSTTLSQTVMWDSMIPGEKEQEWARSLEGRVRISLSSFLPHFTATIFYWSKQVTRPTWFEEVQKKTLPLNGDTLQMGCLLGGEKYSQLCERFYCGKPSSLIKS